MYPFVALATYFRGDNFSRAEPVNLLNQFHNRCDSSDIYGVFIVNLFSVLNIKTFLFETCFVPYHKNHCANKVA